MELTYLGTAASEGWPAVFCPCPICQAAAKRGGKDARLRAGALVDEELLLDLPPDLFAASRKCGVSLHQVRTVVITHSHQDHLSQDVLHWFGKAFNRRADEAPLRLFASREVLSFMEKQREAVGESAFLPFVQPVAVAPFEACRVDEQTTLTPFPALHARPGQGAQVYLLTRGQKKLLYLHDTQGLTEETLSFLAQARVDLVSMDCTAGPVQPAPGSGHMGFADDYALRQRLLDLEIATPQTAFVASHVCIHACSFHGEMLFHDQMAKTLDACGITLAYDGLRVQV